MNAPMWLVPLLALCVSALSLRWLLGDGQRRMALDRPNERSLHSQPVPRSGGLAVMAATLLTLLLIDLPERGVLLAALLALVAVSLVDDFRGLSAGLRFSVHALVAVAVVLCLPIGETSWIWVAVAIPSMVWMTNLFNFMDGSDGLAGGMAAFGFGTLGIAAQMAGDVGMATLCFSVVAASAAFLRVNWHPARIFMGDGGSVPLGFMAAALGLVGAARGLWPVWLPPLAFFLFIFDATVTLCCRAVRGEKFWRAHRTHYYQRMVRMGLGHARTAKLCYVAMAGSGVTALLALALAPDAGPWLMLAWSVAYAIAARVIDVRWRRHQASNHLTA